MASTSTTCTTAPQTSPASGAVRIHLDLNSKLSMGVHWGTFRLCDDVIEAPMDGLPVARQKYGVADEATVLFALGQTRVLKPAQSPP